MSCRGAFVVLCLVSAGAWAAPYDDPNGNTHVVCMHDASQSYELYIPPTAPATDAPILYAFDPGANGKAVLVSMADAARENGWIVAASNNSQNGPWTAIFTAQDAIIQDTEARLDLHPTRRFATGFSGGARSSLALAFRYPAKICGVLCMGAGWPVNTTLQPSTDRLVVRILIGTLDSNYDYDIPRTQGELAQNNVRCEVETYNGDHVWPPAGQVLSCARWLNENAEQDPNEGVGPESAPANSLFCQLPPATTEGWATYISDTYYDYTAYDDFQGVQGAIRRVQWWGVPNVYNSASGYWVPTEPTSDTFTVRFFTDNGGAPGDLVHEETLTAIRTELPGLYSNNFRPLRYTANLSVPVDLSSGWLSVQQEPAPGSVVTWLCSTSGNGRSLTYSGYDNLLYSLDSDFAFSLDSGAISCGFTLSDAWGVPPHAVQFHGTMDGDFGEEVSWHWDFGDGTTADGDANPVHEYLTEGTFTVTLTVSTPTRTSTFTRESIVMTSNSLPVSGAAVGVLAAVLAGLGALGTRRKN